MPEKEKPARVYLGGQNTDAIFIDSAQESTDVIVTRISANDHPHAPSNLSGLDNQSPRVNGAGNDDLLAAIDSLVEQAAVEPADLLTAGKVQRLVDQVADFAGHARQAGLDALRILIGCLPAAEREQLKLDRLFKPPRQHEQIAGFLAGCPAPAGAPIFSPKSFADLLAMPPKEWLIAQIFGIGDIGMMFGPPGSGKSFIAIDLILAACAGKQWAGRFAVARPLTVAYCAGEGVSGLPQRFAAAAQHYGVDDLPNFSFFDSAPQLFMPERGSSATAETIERFIAEWQHPQHAGAAAPTGRPLDLLIVDTLHSASVGADENSAQDMGRILQAIKSAARELGCAALLIHHSNKAGTGERGSSALRGAMDFMIEVKPAAGKFAIACAKLKDGAAWKPQTFDLVELGDSARVWWDEPREGGASAGSKAADKDALLTELQRYPSQRFTVKQLAAVIAKSDNYTRNLLAELVDAGECERELSDPGKPASPRNSWVYALKYAHREHDSE